MGCPVRAEVSPARIRVTCVSVAGVRSSPEELLAGLDPEQREVATTLGGPVAVIAGAGTGKTRAITHRIAYGVAIGAYNPTSVLAVTFTTRAAGELRGRLQQLGAYGVQARTFHSAALRQAQYFWPRIYGGELPAVVDNRMSLVAEAASRLRVRVDTPKLRDLVGEISWAKVSNVSVDDYPRLAAEHNRVLASLDPETIGRIFAGYESAKRDRSRIDFEDILLCAAALISDHPEVADAVRRTYRHLVVDEYQDVSPLQEALLNLWRGDRQEICVVGDPAQTIHSFAGAKAGFLTDFARRYRSASIIRLVRDYRSTPQVVGCANKVMSQLAAGGWPAGGDVGGPAVTWARTDIRPSAGRGERSGRGCRLARPPLGRSAWLIARWRCCFGSMHSHRLSSRPSRSAASPTWCAEASGSTSGRRCARHCWPCAPKYALDEGGTAAAGRSVGSNRSRPCSPRSVGHPSRRPEQERFGNAGNRSPRC